MRSNPASLRLEIESKLVEIGPNSKSARIWSTPGKSWPAGVSLFQSCSMPQETPLAHDQLATGRRRCPAPTARVRGCEADAEQLVILGLEQPAPDAHGCGPALGLRIERVLRPDMGPAMRARARSADDHVLPSRFVARVGLVESRGSSTVSKNVRARDSGRRRKCPRHPCDAPQAMPRLLCTGDPLPLLKV